MPLSDDTSGASSRETVERAVFFIADAHLGGLGDPDDELNERDLEDLLGRLDGRASHLYLLGDIFDFWFEYRLPSNHGHARVLAALRRLSASGAAVTILGGNHDYWLGSEFEELTAASVSRDPRIVEHFGRRIFLAHGDGLPAGDWGYRILKRILRSPVSIALFRQLSPALGGRLAVHVSNVSGITEDRVQRAIPPMRDFLFSKLDEGLDAAVVGHVHAPCAWHRDAGDAIIVGDWMTHRSVVALDAGGFHMLRWEQGTLVANDAVRRGM